jgi:hypothetical protein
MLRRVKVKMIETNLVARRLVAFLAGGPVTTETLTDADWQCIIALVRKQSVAALLYVRLKERGITPTPAVQGNIARMGMERIADKLAALYEALFPSRAAMALMYHAPATSWRILSYYPVRIKDLWMRYSRVMWQLLSGDKQLSSEVHREAHLRDYLGWN